jgi:serine/threonine-protein kinase
MTHPAPPLRQVAIGVSAHVANVVDRALAFNKAMRWPDARRMQESVRHAYHDRTGASIATAPRLTVPESVENRTLPSHDALSRGLPTTVRPVARASSRFLGDKRRSMRALAGLGALISVAAIAMAVSGVGRTRDGVRTAAGKAGMTQEVSLPPAAASAAVVPPAVVLPPPSAASSALPGAGAEPAGGDAAVEALLPLPEVAATDLPSAVPPPAQPAPSGGKGGSTGAPGKANCSPPYVINPATGKKNWKVECL